jgi:hypothetical protein
VTTWSQSPPSTGRTCSGAHTHTGFE